MGTSHFRSSVVGKAGTETIKGFAEVACATLTATTITIGGNQTVGGTLTVTGNAGFTGAVNATGAVNLASTLTVDGKVHAAAYIRLGTAKPYVYIFAGELETQASVEAYATAIDASVKGSLYISNYATPNVWYFSADDTAATLSH